MNDALLADAFSAPVPRTWLLLDCIFPDRTEATNWLGRHNQALGGSPAALIRGGREREVQRYLAEWFLPVEPPPLPFERILERPEPIRD